VVDETKTPDIKNETQLAAEAAEKLSESLKRGVDILTAMNSAIKETYGNLADATSQADLFKQVLTLAQNSNTAITDSQKETLKTQQQLTKETENTSQNYGMMPGPIGLANKLIASQVVAAKQVNKEVAKTSGLIQKGAAQAKDGGFFGSILNWGKDLIISIGDTAKDIKEGIETVAKKAVGLAVTFALKSNPIVTQTISAVVSLYTELSTLTTGYAKFTGQVIKGDAAVSNFSGRVIRLQRRNRLLGATIKDITETYTNLTKASATYGILMGTNRKQNIALGDELTEVAFRLSKVGLSTENFGTALDVLGKTYRRTDILRQSKDLGAEFVNIARVTGQSADVVAKNFSTAMEHLAAYSLPRAREEFKKLSAISAVAGVEMSTVMKVAGQFDDIEKTAESVGELNAMMGGPYLNTLDLVNASESECIDMLKNMMTQSGESFNQMDRFKQKAIAKTLGMDVQTASRMFSGQQKDIDSLSGSINKNAASFSQLGDAATKSATSITEQFIATKQSTLLVNKAFQEVDIIARKANKALATLGDKVRHTLGGIMVGTLKEVNREMSNLIKLTNSVMTGKGGEKDLTMKVLKLLGQYKIWKVPGMIMDRAQDVWADMSSGKKQNELGPGTPADREVLKGAMRLNSEYNKLKQAEGVQTPVENVKAEEETSWMSVIGAQLAELVPALQAQVENAKNQPPMVAHLLLDSEVAATAIFQHSGLAT